MRRIMSLWLIGAGFAAGQVSNRKDVHYSVDTAVCSDVVFPGWWKFHDTLSSPNRVDESLDDLGPLEYRTLPTTGRELAVRAQAHYSESGEHVSTVQYAVTLAVPSSVSELSQDEWALGRPFQFEREDLAKGVFPPLGEKQLPPNTVRYQSRSFVSRGHYLDSALLSPDRKNLLLGSYSGRPHLDIIWGGDLPFSGPFYMELLGIASSKHKLLAKGHFRHGISSSYFTERNGWVNNNIIILSLDPTLKKLVICDATK